jgi:Tfp pilus assembly protein FimT
MRGHTVVELLLVMTLMAASAASLAPAARLYRDRAAVLAAREAFVGLLAEARAAAMEAGRGEVHVTSDPWEARAVVGETTVRAVALARDYDVGLTLSGGRSEVVLRFDALGLGRLANQTVVFSRGEARAELTISAYGRVRRR